MICWRVLQLTGILLGAAEETDNISVLQDAFLKHVRFQRRHMPGWNLTFVKNEDETYINNEGFE